MQEDGERGGVGGENDNFGGSTVEGFGCCGWWLMGEVRVGDGGVRDGNKRTFVSTFL